VSADEDRSSAGWPVTEYHQRMGLHAEAFIDEPLGQGGDPDITAMGGVLQLLV
jgi:hypothetical protein